MAKTPKSPTSFENAVTELDAIVQAMESADGLSLEQSLEHYQRGVELMRYCRSAARRTPNSASGCCRATPWKTFRRGRGAMSADSTAFLAWMAKIQQRTETALASTLPDAAIAPARLHEAMRYAVLGGGKRVRPLLVHAAGEIAARRGGDARPVAVRSS